MNVVKQLSNVGEETYGPDFRKFDKLELNYLNTLIKEKAEDDSGACAFKKYLIK